MFNYCPSKCWEWHINIHNNPNVSTFTLRYVIAWRVILAHPETYSSLISGQFSARAIIHLSVRLWIPANAIMVSFEQLTATSQIPVSVSSQFLKLICLILVQLRERAVAMVSVISLRPATVMVSRLVQLVTMSCTTLDGNYIGGTYENKNRTNNKYNCDDAEYSVVYSV